MVTVPNERAMFGGLTYTDRRDDLWYATIGTTTSNATTLLLSTPEGNVELTGAQARTLQRLLNKHYDLTGRSRVLLGA